MPNPNLINHGARKSKPPNILLILLSKFFIIIPSHFKFIIRVVL